MNQADDIKKLLERYFEGTSSDEDEQRLRTYFISAHVADEWQPYRPIFECIARKRRERETPVRQMSHYGKYWVWTAAAACIALAVWLPSRFAQRQQPVTCTGTFVMVDGHCSNDLELVKKYAILTLDRMSEPSEEQYDPLDFLDDDFYQEQITY
ncbi:MAG: hypothetical protein LBS09_04695 [Bacteroidales bacterium]|jgi:hypothetical protein|nr:hypothetical protein [Bacteroidales bacterium]